MATVEADPVEIIEDDEPGELDSIRLDLRGIPPEAVELGEGGRFGARSTGIRIQ